MNCEDIIKNWLKANEYDGLFNEVSKCGCEIGNLFPCGQLFSGCRPGYKVVPPEGTDCEYDFYICEYKDSKPWEWE